ncbi:MAG: hypothetical protein JW751_24545 [Polyangiaceae bacterium]|nr:hypothetical protein [Polyangiaceae bacterium]
MNIRDLVAIYLVVGLVCGLIAFRRGRRPRLGLALATGLVWPLVAPFTLADPRPQPRRPPADPRADGGSTAEHELVQRVVLALEGGLVAVANTPCASVFTPVAAAKFEQAVRRAAARLTELEAALVAAGGDAAAELGQYQGTTAKRRVVARLTELRRQTQQELEELAEVLEALRCRFLLARFEDLDHDEVATLIAEARAHLEALGEAS